MMIFWRELCLEGHKLASGLLAMLFFDSWLQQVFLRHKFLNLHTCVVCTFLKC